MAKWHFQKGNPGRPKGATNKLTISVREAFLKVFNDLQEDKNHNLMSFANKNPRHFYSIAAKLIPTEIQGILAGNLEIKEPTWFHEPAEMEDLDAIVSELTHKELGNS
jgi:hypothetical protein